MAYILEFKIDTVTHRQVQPIYSIGSDQPIMMSTGPSYNRLVVSFADGTMIIKEYGLFLFNNKHFSSLDDLFEVLSENIIETIIFNIEIFRSL